MILIPDKQLILPRRFGSRKNQRGNFAMFPAGTISSSGDPGIVLDAGNGGTVSQTDGVSPYDTTVGIRFNTDGTVETGKAINGGAVVWTAAGSWIIPNGDADTSYSVRFTGSVQDVGTGKFTTEAAVEDTWIGLVSAVRTWLSNKTTSGQRTFHCTFEVRKTAGAPPTTGSSVWTFDIDNVV